MTSIRRFKCTDLFQYNNVNLDPLTETFGLNFYLRYLIQWPEFFLVAQNYSGRLSGYIMGKSEGQDTKWHSHVTAVSVAPEFRRIGLAGLLMAELEKLSVMKNCFFVDLFVRVSNTVAIKMYEQLGYIVYRRVLGYYSGGPGEEDEDAFDMRKALPRDVEKKSVIPLDRPIRPEELEHP